MQVIENWCSEARVAMARSNVRVKDVATKTGYTAQYISMLVNGKMYSEEACRKISDVLEIKPPAGCTLTV